MSSSNRATRISLESSCHWLSVDLFTLTMERAMWLRGNLQARSEFRGKILPFSEILQHLVLTVNFNNSVALVLCATWLDQVRVQTIQWNFMPISWLLHPEISDFFTSPKDVRPTKSWAPSGHACSRWSKRDIADLPPSVIQIDSILVVVDRLRKMRHQGACTKTVTSAGVARIIESRVSPCPLFVIGMCK